MSEEMKKIREEILRTPVPKEVDAWLDSAETEPPAFLLKHDDAQDGDVIRRRFFVEAAKLVESLDPLSGPNLMRYAQTVLKDNGDGTATYRPPLMAKPIDEADIPAMMAQKCAEGISECMYIAKAKALYEMTDKTAETYAMPAQTPEEDAAEDAIEGFERYRGYEEFAPRLKVPGTGPVEKVWFDDGAYFAARNGITYKATASGWVALDQPVDVMAETRRMLG